MNDRRLTAAALWTLAGGILAATLLGPLALGVVRFRVSASAEQQLIGGEIASLALAVPVAAIAGWLWWRGSRLGPMLALGPGAYAAYMYTQYIIGPEYSRYPGNNERAFPLYLALGALGGWIAVDAWRTLGAREAAPPPHRLRRAIGWLLIVTGAVFALAWIGSIADVLGGSPSDDYLRDPQLFWLVRFMDLGGVIPLAVIAGAGTLRAAPWSPRATVVAMGFLTLIVAAVAGMAIRLQVTGDPGASTVFTVVTAVFAALYLALTAILVRDDARPDSRVAPAPASLPVARGRLPDSNL
jgi:hypothetical protein